MYLISKVCVGSYGHRVYSQDVNADYAGGDATNGCHHLHGHQLALTVAVCAKELDHRTMVIDFKELGFVKKFVDSCVDHRFLVSLHDPNFEKITGVSTDLVEKLSHSVFFHDDEFAGCMFNKDAGNSVLEQVHLNSFLIVYFNPTSEELARWVYEGVSAVLDKSPFNAIVKDVTWSETPKTKAVYSR